MRLDSGYFNLWCIGLSNTTVTSGSSSGESYSLFSMPDNFQELLTLFRLLGKFHLHEFFKTKASLEGERYLGHYGEVVSSIRNRPGARGPAGGLPRAPDRTGRLAVVRPICPKGRTAVFGKDGGPYRVRHVSTGQESGTC